MNHKELTQTMENLKGEIEFRAKLAHQHVTGEILIPDYYDLDAHNQILLGRMQTTAVKMKELIGLGVNLSPFLELGAERGQRSLVLTNDFGAEGVSIDISFHQLATIQHFSRFFQKEKQPLKICCDANHLPFRSNSFPFLFCYQFLHHFPSVRPVLKEIHRVLSTGYFYFDEEPFKRLLKLNLYRQEDKIYSEKFLSKNKYVNLAESFISEPQCDEVEYGIIENNNISLAEWQAALSIFDEYDVTLSSIYNIESKLGPRLRAGNVLNLLLGGRIAGLCSKKTGEQSHPQKDIKERLACPDCRVPLQDNNLDHPPLLAVTDGYQCIQCGFIYPSRDGILFVLPKFELQQLYPEVYYSQC